MALIELNHKCRLNEERALFRSEYGVESELVRAARVSQIFGIPISTLHQLVREERFPIPHQKLGRSVFFALDDLALWRLRQRQEGGAAD